MKDRKTLKTVLITFFATLVFVTAIVLLVLSNTDFPYKKFLRVVSMVENSYVGEYDREEIEEKAIDAFLNSIGDDYAEYYNEENLTDLMTLIDGHYYGIGAEVFANSEKGRIEIIAAIDGSPAEKAGIKSGDLIKSIDGKNYTHEELNDAVMYLKGVDIEDPLEKDVKIVLIRGEDEVEITLKREDVNMYKVNSQVIDGICYIKYKGFTETSYTEFKDVIDNLDDSIKGVVIDLRNNPGGELTSAINMCDIFLDDEVVMYTVDKEGKKNYYNAKKGSTDIPLAVLVNGASASASEVFAGAIKAHERGVIVGERTYGKGVTQTVMPINPIKSADGAIKLTTYKNYTPDGKWINEGISPDIEVSDLGVTIQNIEEDPCFIEAVKSLKKD